MTDAVREVFGEGLNGDLAMHLETALDRVVAIGLDLAKHNRDEQDETALGGALERRAVPIIEGIMDLIRPEVRGGLQYSDAPAIWQTYWELRRSSSSVKYSLFVVLGDYKKPTS